MASIATLSRLSAVMTLDITRFMRNSEIVSARLKQLRSDAIKFGQGFTRVFTFGFALVGGAAIKAAADFDELNAQLAAVTGGKGVEQLTKQAKLLGRETVFTATQVAGLQLELAKLGFSAGEVADAVEASTKISAVFGGDLVKTGTTIAEVVRQFSNENLSSARVADVMAVAFQRSALSTENFAQAMKNVGSIANITNVGFEETVALLGVLANAGQKGGIAGTRLKGVLIRLGKELGVTGNELQLLTSGQLDFNQLIDLFKNRAGVAAAVISELGEEFEILKQQINDSDGAAAALESGLSKRLFFSLKRIQAATEAAGIAVGESFAPLLEQTASILSGFAEFLEGADKGTLQLVTTLLAIAAVLPPLIFLFTQLAASLRFLIANPIVAVLAALAAVGVAVATEYRLTNKVLNDFDQSLSDLGDTFKNKFQNTIDGTAEQVAALREEIAKTDDPEAVDLLNKSIENLEARAITAKENLEALASTQAVSQLADQGVAQRYGRLGLDSTDDAFADLVKDQRVLDDLNARLEKTRITANNVAKALAGDSRYLDRPATQKFLDQTNAKIFDLEASIRNVNGNMRLLREILGEVAKESVKGITDLDLSLFSEAELRAQKAEFDATATDLQNTLERLENTSTGFLGRTIATIGAVVQFIFESLGLVFSIGEGFFDKAAGVEQKFYENLDRIFNTEELIEKTNFNIAQNKALQLKYQEELNKKTELQNRQAEEALQLAKDYAALFNDAADAAGSVEAFQKLKDEIIQVASAFATAENDVDRTASLISTLTDGCVDLTSVLQSGEFDIDILGSFAKGDLDNRITAVQGATKAISDFIKEAVASEKYDLAAIFVPLKKDAEALLDRLERIKRINGFAKTAADAEALAKALGTAGVNDELKVLQSILSAVQSQLNSTFGETGVLDEKLVQRVKDLRAEIEALKGSSDFQLELGLFDPRNQGPEKEIELFIDLIERDLAAAIANVNDEFNKLTQASTLFGDDFDLGASAGVLSIEKLDEAIKKGKASLSTFTEGTDAFNDALSDLRALEDFKVLLTELEARLKAGKIDMEAYNAELEKLKDTAAIKDLANEFKNLAGSEIFKALTPAEQENERLRILTDLYERARLNAEALSQTDFENLDGLTAKLEETRKKVEELEYLEELMGFVAQQMSFVGDAFIAAARNGENFFTSLKDGFLNMFAALIGKLITLIALFAVLNALTNGAFMAGGTAGTNFAQFLATGLGIPTRSAGGGLGLGSSASTTKSLAVEGSISGNNIVLANQRGTRAIDRTFG